MSVKLIGNSLFLDGQEFTEDSLKSGSVNVKIESISTTKSSASTTLTGYNSEDSHVVFKGNNLSTDHTLNGNKITINTGDYTVLSIEGVEIENYGVTDTGSYCSTPTFERVDRSYVSVPGFTREDHTYVQVPSFTRENKTYTSSPTFIREDKTYTSSPSFIREDKTYTSSPSFVREDKTYVSTPTFTAEEII